MNDKVVQKLYAMECGMSKVKKENNSEKKSGNAHKG